MSSTSRFPNPSRSRFSGAEIFFSRRATPSPSIPIPSTNTHLSSGVGDGFVEDVVHESFPEPEQVQVLGGGDLLQQEGHPVPLHPHPLNKHSPVVRSW